MGKVVERAEIAETIKIHDKTGLGMLDFKEFVGLFDVYLGKRPAQSTRSNTMGEEKHKPPSLTTLSDSM